MGQEEGCNRRGGTVTDWRRLGDAMDSQLTLSGLDVRTLLQEVRDSAMCSKR